MAGGENYKIVIRVDDEDSAAANKSAMALRQVILESAGDDLQSLELVKEDKTTQDLGATLAVVLGTPAAIAVAKGIANYIAKHGDNVIIETENGRVIASGSGAQNIDVAATVEALQGSSD